MANKIDYYCVGCYWYDADQQDQLPRFIEQGIWENGFEDKLLQKVKNVEVGSKIAAKKSYTRKVNGKVVSVLDVQALGTVTENPGDGRILKVSWDKNFNPFKIDGAGAYRSTISRIHKAEYIDIIFNKKTNKSAVSTTESEDLQSEFPLNQILFGPPGTGKTFSTISKAVSIIDGIKEEALLNYYDTRADLKDRFEELKEMGQIVFCSFHQSMSYEDFIEGIKPKMPDEETEEDLGYELVDGVFKRLCFLAKYDFYKRTFDSTSSQISRAEFFTHAYEEFVSSIEERLDKGEEVSLDTKTGSKLYITQISDKLNLKIKHQGGQREKPYTVSKNRLLKLFTHFKDLNEIKSIQKEIRAVIGGSNTTAYWAVLSLIYEVFEKVKAKGVISKETKEEKNYETIKAIVNSFVITREKVLDTAAEKYVLIIDEINRGNISQIFGELITLIEEDKRLGSDEALECTLPYSKEKFGVPPNLHIIGTMNTADRSVEALDTALRRRFTFKEIAPQPEFLSPLEMLRRFWDVYYEKYWGARETYEVYESEISDLIGMEVKDWKVYTEYGNNEENSFSKEEFEKTLKPVVSFNGLNLQKLLETINHRIEVLTGKDHKIGHSYLMNVFSWSDLKDVFSDKIIPLLQEYFFGDYGKIGLVLGPGFVKIKKASKNVFAEFEYDSENYEDKAIYELLDYRKESVYNIQIKNQVVEMDFKTAINYLLK